MTCPALKDGVKDRLLEAGKVYSALSIFKIYFARFSLISLWHGTACAIFVFGFRYQSCFEPCLTSTQPAASILRIRSLRFIGHLPMQFPTHLIFSHWELNRFSDQNKYLSGFLLTLPAYGLVSSNQEILSGTRSTFFHPASKQILLYSSPCFLTKISTN